MRVTNRPLADRIRPTGFDGIIGQDHLFGHNGAISRMTGRGYLTNMIFYGPPGTGKTTAAGIIAAGASITMHRLNATSASLADVKDIIAETDGLLGTNGILLYLDEIQYFNKKQQQSLLEYIEDGRIILIASTTENPYMYVYNAIISRSAVFEFKAVGAKAMLPVLSRALACLNEETGRDKTAEAGLLEKIAESGAGDVRRAIGLLENAYYACDDLLTTEVIEGFTPKVIGSFDRAGIVHYDMLSALQKSIRGSDPDATVFYLAKILEGGDLIGACRRLQVIASEDIGLAYPSAPVIVGACVDSALRLGMPEAHIPLAHAALLLATAPKSNSAIIAYDAAKADIDSGRGQSVPSHMRPSNQTEGYLYPHNYPGHYVRQQYLPDDIADHRYYEYGDNKTERAAREYWEKLKGGK